MIFKLLTLPYATSCPTVVVGCHEQHCTTSTVLQGCHACDQRWIVKKSVFIDFYIVYFDRKWRVSEVWHGLESLRTVTPDLYLLQLHVSVERWKHSDPTSSQRVTVQCVVSNWGTSVLRQTLIALPFVRVLLGWHQLLWVWTYYEGGGLEIDRGTHPDFLKDR